MLDTGKLVLLREVSLRGSVTSAAASLGVSASNISQRLSRLERECGVALLESEGRGVRLTSAALRLVEHTEQILELLARRADIAVADEYPGHPLPPSSGLRSAVLGKEPIRAYLPAGIDDPATAVWAMEPRASDSFRWSRGICRAAGFEPRVQFESPDPYVHRRLVEQGVAAAFLPAGVAEGLDGAAPVTEFPDDMHRRHITLIRRGTERSPTVSACLAALQVAWNEAWAAAN